MCCVQTATLLLATHISRQIRTRNSCLSNKQANVLTSSPYTTMCASVTSVKTSPTAVYNSFTQIPCDLQHMGHSNPHGIWPYSQEHDTHATVSVLFCRAGPGGTPLGGLQPAQRVVHRPRPHSGTARVLSDARWTMITAACSALLLMSWKAAGHMLPS